MSLETFIRQMPKAELHVHLEGSIQPTTLLMLAQRHRIELPAWTVEGVRQWYRFSDFSHFIEVYLAISACIRTPEDIELIAQEFLAGQSAQNIRYSEVTYTAYTHFHFKGIPFREQLAALNRARAWAADEFGIMAGIVIDIPRVLSAEEGLLIADWAISGMGDGVVALGLGGPESGNPPERYSEAFERARSAGLARVPHAGETEGPESIWGALRTLHADRIGHGVRCLEDPQLVAELRARQVPLEVCPTSNVCLHVAPTLDNHPLPRLLDEGLFVTLNSDDPPLFDTTLTDEYLKVARTFQMGPERLEQFALNAVRASILPEASRRRLAAEFETEFKSLREAHLTDDRDHPA